MGHLQCVLLVHVGHWLVLEREQMVKAGRSEGLQKYPSVCSPQTCPSQQHMNRFSATGPTSAVERPTMTAAINSILLGPKRPASIQWYRLCWGATNNVIMAYGKGAIDALLIPTEMQLVMNNNWVLNETVLWRCCCWKDCHGWHEGLSNQPQWSPQLFFFLRALFPSK